MRFAIFKIYVSEQITMCNNTHYNRMYVWLTFFKEELLKTGLKRVVPVSSLQDVCYSLVVWGLLLTILAAIMNVY
jgi:hypothetical protein